MLDAGCGNGWYAEQLLDAGATVTAFDREPQFVEITRQRVGNRPCQIGAIHVPERIEKAFEALMHADKLRPCSSVRGSREMSVRRAEQSGSTAAP